MAIERQRIEWRLHLDSEPRRVFHLLATDEGRASFWAEKTCQEGDRLTFHFPGGESLQSRILSCEAPHLFSLTYFDRTTVVFELREARPGTDLLLTENDLSASSFVENKAGWVSVLMALKARADHDVDLRNHDPERTWAQGYVDN